MYGGGRGGRGRGQVGTAAAAEGVAEAQQRAWQLSWRAWSREIKRWWKQIQGSGRGGGRSNSVGGARGVAVIAAEGDMTATQRGTRIRITARGLEPRRRCKSQNRIPVHQRMCQRSHQRLKRKNPRVPWRWPKLALQRGRHRLHRRLVETHLFILYMLLYILAFFEKKHVYGKWGGGLLSLIS